MSAPVDVLAVMSRKRPTFRDAAMRRSYDACVAAYREKGTAYMAEGNSAAGMFRRGFTGQHAGAWDAASRKTVAYAAFRAGQDCAQEAAHAAVAELIDSQQADARLVAVLLSYLNDNLSEREKGRLGAELATRDLSDHAERRALALARVGGGK